MHLVGTAAFGSDDARAFWGTHPPFPSQSSMPSMPIWYILHESTRSNRDRPSSHLDSERLIERDFALDGNLVRGHSALEEIRHLLNILQFHEREGIARAETYRQTQHQ